MYHFRRQATRSCCSAVARTTAGAVVCSAVSGTAARPPRTGTPRGSRSLKILCRGFGGRSPLRSFFKLIIFFQGFCLRPAPRWVSSCCSAVTRTTAGTVVCSTVTGTTTRPTRTGTTRGSRIPLSHALRVSGQKSLPLGKNQACKGPVSRLNLERR